MINPPSVNVLSQKEYVKRCEAILASSSQPKSLVTVAAEATAAAKEAAKEPIDTIFEYTPKTKIKMFFKKLPGKINGALTNLKSLAKKHKGATAAIVAGTALVGGLLIKNAIDKKQEK